MTPEILARLRAAIDDDPRTSNRIATEAKISPPLVYRLMGGKSLTVETAARLGEVVGLRIEVVCESIVEP